MSFSVFFLNLIGLVLLTMSTFQPDNYSTHVEKSAVINELLLVHIGLAVLSYAFYALAFVNALLLLFNIATLKRKILIKNIFALAVLLH